MQLEDFKDANGTSLMSYADTLRDKAKEQGVVVLFVFAKPTGEGDTVDIKTLTNMQGDPSSVLLELGQAMAKAPANVQK